MNIIDKTDEEIRDIADPMWADLVKHSNAGNYDDALSMMLHPNTILGISDGGAHCGMICDAGAPSYLLQHFVRDRSRGPRMALEQAVKMQTRDTAELYGFLDRGLVRQGYRADLNLIDLERLPVPLERRVVVPALLGHHPELMI